MSDAFKQVRSLPKLCKPLLGSEKEITPQRITVRTVGQTRRQL